MDLLHDSTRFDCVPAFSWMALDNLKLRVISQTEALCASGTDLSRAVSKVLPLSPWNPHKPDTSVDGQTFSFLAVAQRGRGNLLGTGALCQFWENASEIPKSWWQSGDGVGVNIFFPATILQDEQGFARMFYLHNCLAEGKKDREGSHDGWFCGARRLAFPFYRGDLVAMI